MDGYKPEDELRPDPSDRPSGRSRQNANFDNDPRINMDDMDIDADERTPVRPRRVREEPPHGARAEHAEDPHPPRKRSAAALDKPPVSRQYVMTGVGILVLLLIIVGIGSALKGPASDSKVTTADNRDTQRNIDLSNGTTPQNRADANTAQSNTASREIGLPPVSTTPTQSQPVQTQNGQQRMEIPGDLNNALMPPQGQQDVSSDTAHSTLPTQSATVAVVGNNKGLVQAPRNTARVPQQVTPPRRRHTEPRQTTVIEPPSSRVTQATRSQPVPRTPVLPKTPPSTPQNKVAPAPAVKSPVAHSENTSVKASSSAVAAPKVIQAKPTSATTAPVVTSTAKNSVGNVSALTSASASGYTLQLSSSSNFSNLNTWAKKENLQDYVVYQAQRNGQPWYVLVKGIYASKDEAKRAVSSLPADVQAKNPWAKPIHQVQSDLK